MPDLTAGSKVTALDTPAPARDVQADEYTTTTTTLGVAASGAYATCGKVFTAPTSGRVMVLLAAEVSHSSTGQVIVAPVVRTGGTIGSGTVAANGDPDGALYLGGTTRQRTAMFYPVGGLTPGAVYNVRLEHRVGPSGTGTIRRRYVAVEPST